MQQGVYDLRVICDVCKVYIENQSEQTEPQAMQQVMNEGWRVKFGMDFCPRHAKETKGMSESDIHKLIAS